MIMVVYLVYILKKGAEHILNKLKEIRKDKGITQVLLAEKSGISRQTIHRLENGEDKVATTKTLKALADALGVHVSDFFLP